MTSVALWLCVAVVVIVSVLAWALHAQEMEAYRRLAPVPGAFTDLLDSQPPLDCLTEDVPTRTRDNGMDLTREGPQSDADVPGGQSGELANAAMVRGGSGRARAEGLASAARARPDRGTGVRTVVHEHGL